MRIILSFIFLVCFFSSFSQSSYVPLNEDYYHWIDRYEIKTGRIIPEIFTTIKPYKRSAIISFIDSANQYDVFASRADQFNYTYLRNDSWEWSGPETSDSRKAVLKTFYKKKSDFFYVDDPSFDLHVNPVLYLGAGSDSREDEMLFINSRGVEIRGTVDKKIGFYSILTDNQARLPSYAQDYLSMYYVVPHEGFWKTFKDNKGVDFIHARDTFLLRLPSILIWLSGMTGFLLATVIAR
jgi:hypothetical protein